MADRMQGTTQEPGKTQDAARTPDMKEQARELGTQVQDKARELGTQVQDKAQEVGTQVRDWAQEKGNQLKKGAQDTMHQVEASASQLSDMGRTATEELEESLEDRIRYKPLQSVLVAAGVGILIGLLWRK